MREIDAIVVHHTAGRHTSLTWEEIRKYHMEVRGFSDIAYHYGIVNDSKLLSDGGWTWRTGRPVELPGAHAKGFNAFSIGVVFEGNYSVDELPADALTMGVVWITSLLRRWKLPVSRVFPHRAVGTTKTECPGKKFPWDQLVTRIERELAKG